MNELDKLIPKIEGLYEYFEKTPFLYFTRDNLKDLSSSILALARIVKSLENRFENSRFGGQ